MDATVCRPWLPPGALDRAAVERLLSDEVGDWSDKWFARRKMRILGRSGKAQAGPPVAKGEGWHFLDEGFGMAVATGAFEMIAAAILDAAVDEKALSADDRAVVERVTDGCLRDLRMRFAQMLRIAPETCWLEEPPGAAADGTWTYAVGTSEGEPLIRLLLAPDLQVLVTKLAVRSAPLPVRLRPLADGLGAQPVHVSAFVGGCELALSEVAALAEGDVVVLDRDVAAPLELAIGAGARSGRCRLEDEDEQLCIKMIQPFFD